ncbi:MAG: GNAT family N-acetyltransferase [Succinimonas sp.]|nr:GNAT family N-acetyltransferase [Succinimonas sp.]
MSSDASNNVNGDAVIDDAASEVISEEPVFRAAAADDTPALAACIREVSPDVVDTLLKGLIPGINPEYVLTTALRDDSSHYSYRNCVLAEIAGNPAGLLFAYPAENQGIPAIMERMIAPSRLDPMRELLTVAVPGSLYINTLWVAAGVRGQGMADALMDYARFWAESLGLNSLSLFCWRDNARARAFYLRQGFKPRREIPAKGPLKEKHDIGDLYELQLGA